MVSMKDTTQVLNREGAMCLEIKTRYMTKTGITKERIFLVSQISSLAYAYYSKRTPKSETHNQLR